MKRYVCFLMSICLLFGCSSKTEVPEVKNEIKEETVVFAQRPAIRTMPEEEDYIRAGRRDDEKWSEDYDAWRQERHAFTEEAAPYEKTLSDFAERIAAVMTAEKEENIVYSPLNIFLALGMLAETTDAGTRKQILDLLGIEDTDTLRKAADALWKVNYSTGDYLTSVLSDSVWLDDRFDCRMEIPELLAEVYHADTYRVRMGIPETDKKITEWIDAATDALLQEKSSGIRLEDETRMVLISAILYKAGWINEFNPDRTDRQIFHTPSGDREIDMMHAEREELYFRGNNWSAVRMSLNGGGMWIVLPDEGTDVKDIAQSGKVREMIASGGMEGMSLRVRMSLPKTDITADTDLSAVLRKLGITDVFEPEKADFSPLSDEELYLDRAQHAARVIMDEEGVYAAAYTMLMVAATGMGPQDTVDFSVDRPFFFTLCGESGSVLFEGIVYDPGK